MILALDYMTRTDTNRALVDRASRYVAQGHNRLLTFESRDEPGAFSLWVGGKPSLFLSAYALMLFSDMERIHKVDTGLRLRIAKYVARHAQPDGSFAAGALSHRWGSWKNTPFYTTAYVAWALAESGHDTSKSLAYLEAHAPGVQDPYGLALAAMAFVSADKRSDAARSMVARLLSLRTEAGTWAPDGETFVGGRGRTGDIETTALAALVLARDGRHRAALQDALDKLIAWRGADGRFGSTHSTVLALKALVRSQDRGASPAGKVTVHGGAAARHVVLPSGSTERVRVALGTLDPNDVRAKLKGDGLARATLTRTTYEPWTQTTLPQGRLALDVAWPDAPLEVGGAYDATVTVTNTSDAKAKIVTLEIGLPPGITIDPDDVTGPGLEEAERAMRTMVLYLNDMAPGEARTFKLPFRVRYAFEAKTAASRAYEYYVEHEQTVTPPLSLQAK